MELEEYAKICEIISSCNDVINGKFILAHNKINTILKKITDSKEMYNLLANCLNNFDFEREFSRAQMRNTSRSAKFVLPEEPERLLPFVFCLLVNINNNTINLDSFMAEFYPSDTQNHSEEFSKFAEAVLTPFRDIIATQFNVPATPNKEDVEKFANQQTENKEETEDVDEKQDEEYEDGEEYDDEELDDEEDENVEEYDDDEEMDYPELTAEKVENFLNEIKSNCEQILSELPYEKHLKEDTKEDIEYIANAIISNCDASDLDNTIALVTAFDYLTPKSKNVKIYTREMKNVLANFFDE